MTSPSTHGGSVRTGRMFEARGAVRPHMADAGGLGAPPMLLPDGFPESRGAWRDAVPGLAVPAFVLRGECP